MFEYGKGISTTFYESNKTTKESSNKKKKMIGNIKANIGRGRILQKPKELRLVAFTDSDYVNDEEDRKSITR